LIIAVIIAAAVLGGSISALFISGGPSTEKTTHINRESKYVCVVYFTYIGCPNCAVTDPIVLSKWIKEDPRLVIIEYGWRKGDWSHPNAKVAGEYAESYHSQAAVPQLIVSKSRIWLGREDVPSAEPYIKNLKSNLCPLVKGSAPIEDLNIKELPGLPKIWSNNRVLVSLGNGSWIIGWNGTPAKAGDAGEKKMTVKELKSLLFVDDVATALKGYDYTVVGSIMVPFSGSAFPKEMGFVRGAVFKNAVRVDLADLPGS